jgi:hypothetical protein
LDLAKNAKMVEWGFVSVCDGADFKNKIMVDFQPVEKKTN